MRQESSHLGKCECIGCCQRSKMPIGISLSGTVSTHLASKPLYLCIPMRNLSPSTSRRNISICPYLLGAIDSALYEKGRCWCVLIDHLCNRLTFSAHLLCLYIYRQKSRIVPHFQIACLRLLYPLLKDPQTKHASFSCKHLPKS